MADVGLIAQAVTTAPEGYQVPGAQEIILKSVFAQYDGSGAGGDYVPTLQILAPNGAVVATCPLSTTVTAGASVDMCWFPRGGVSAASAAGAGIQFGGPSPVYGADNTGQWLEVNTTGIGGDENVGINLNDQDAANGGIIIESVSPFGIEINENYTGLAGPVKGGIALSSPNDFNSGIALATGGQDNSGVQITVDGATNAGISLADQQFDGTGGGVSVFVKDSASSQLFFFGIPTANPGIPGAVYSLAGVLHIS